MQPGGPEWTGCLSALVPLPDYPSQQAMQQRQEIFRRDRLLR